MVHSQSRPWPGLILVQMLKPPRNANVCMHLCSKTLGGFNIASILRMIDEDNIINIRR